jgi:hypothetical protein
MPLAGSRIVMMAMDVQKRLVIVGATGMVGGYALRYALDHPAVGGTLAIGRKATGIMHPKLKEVIHHDFADCSALAGALSGQDAALFCLGAYTGVCRCVSLSLSAWLPARRVLFDQGEKSDR